MNKWILFQAEVNQSIFHYFKTRKRGYNIATLLEFVSEETGYRKRQVERYILTEGAISLFEDTKKVLAKDEKLSKINKAIEAKAE